MIITKEFIKQLRDSTYRKNEGIFLLQGDRFCRDALKTNIEILHTITTNDNLTGFHNISVVSERIFAGLNDSVGGQKIVCVCKKSIPNLDCVNHSLILDNIQDPGNMGTLIRSAVAFGFYDIFVLGGASPYSDKVVRSSASQILKANIFEVDYDFIDKNKVRIADKFIVADMLGETLDKIHLPKQKIAVIIGNEGSGVSDRLRLIADLTVRIPMTPGVESLNAGVAGSIIMHRLGDIK